MPKEHRLKTRKQSDASLGLPLNFLLGCSQDALNNYAIARLAAVADTRKELLAVMDRLIQLTAQSIVAEWFRKTDRASLNRDLATEESPLEWAKRKIGQGQRSEEELEEFLPGLPPGAAHVAAALRYTERNIAEGKCGVCPQPLDRNSVRYCTKHLTAARMRHKPQGGDDPGSLDYLYQDHSPEKRHGRQPGTLASLAMHREKRTRKVLAELGIPPENAAVSRNAAKESLMKHMPESLHRALPTETLFKVAMIPSRTTGQNAINELLAEGKIQRTGKGSIGDVFRYSRADAPKPETGKTKNRILLQTE